MIKFILIISKSDTKATKMSDLSEEMFIFFKVVKTSVDQFTPKHISFSVYFQNGIHMGYSFPSGQGFWSELPNNFVLLSFFKNQ